jgi:hypothetical protein
MRYKAALQALYALGWLGVDIDALSEMEMGSWSRLVGVLSLRGLRGGLFGRRFHAESLLDPMNIFISRQTQP